MNPEIRRQIVPGPLQDILPVGTTLPDLVAKFVHKADLESRIPELCEELKRDNPTSNRLHELLDQCLGRDNPLSTGRPRWYDDRLPMKKPLIDRDDLRDGLYQMLEADPSNPRVMMVRGTAPGKTYCRCLIQHVAAELGLERPVLIDLLEVDSVNRLAERLVDKLGLSYADLKVRFSTEVREGKYFNDWLSGRSRDFGADKRWLLVFDHLAKEGVPQDVSQTALDLAERAMNRDLTNVWIVLLDCPVTDALEEDPPYEEEVRPITKQSIEKFIAWLLELRLAAGDANPQVPQEAQDLLQQTFPLQKAKLQALRNSLYRWMRQGPRA